MNMAGDYTPSNYDMTMKMESGEMPGGMSMNLEAKVIGKRIGDCPA